VNPRIVHLIAAARPNFMKVAPLYHALAGQSWCTARVVHTGQHYDANMSDAFFRDLRLPEPAHTLEIGSGSHAEQTGRTMIAYEAVCQRERPAAIVVVGTSTLPPPARSSGRSSGSPSCASRQGAAKPDANLLAEASRR
jgi:UDP-N-acetylglucosamine 2-epimerase (non-hydrolysing)